jgi:DNA invertase Pin-like site-specific DNA recombinase
MKGQFQQAVDSAFATFLAEVSRAAEREAIEAIHRAFARASRQGDAVAAAGAPVSLSADRAHRRAMAGVERAAVRERVVACIREHPGWDPAQLARSLAIAPAILRRHLRNLAIDRVIRFDEQRIGLGAQRRRQYFVREPADGAIARAEPALVPTQAPAVCVEAA